ncbi:MAG: hypothetical protein KJ779_06860 [Firmicutes bacterium]|nr:hypothetical protein [Bacillota bacterium]
MILLVLLTNRYVQRKKARKADLLGIAWGSLTVPKLPNNFFSGNSAAIRFQFFSENVITIGNL